MAEQRKFPERKLNQGDMMNNWLYAPPVEQGGKRPNLRVRMTGNSPRFVVKTNVPNDANNGRIEFNTDYITFNVILNTIVRVVKGEITDRVVFDYKDNYVAGKKLDSEMVLSKLEVGRRKDGRVFIAVRSTQQGRPNIAFTFEPSRFHGVATIGGTELTPAQVSEMYAMGWVDMQLTILSHVLNTDFDPDGKGVAKPPQMQGGQGGGGYQNRGGNGGGYQQRQQRSAPPPADSFDEFDEFS